MSGRGQRFLDAMAERPLVMDAAMGTRLGARGLDLKNPEDGTALWNLTHPEDVRAIHDLDVAAGSDVLLTNTFLASRIWLKRVGYGDRVAAINRCAASIAREAAGPDRFVLGSIGPTATTDLTGKSYREQAEALSEAGVDALVFETHSLSQAAAALKAVPPSAAIPVFVSICRFPRGNTGVEGYVKEFEDLGISGIGVNCLAGTDASVFWAEHLRECTRLPLFLKPSVTPRSDGVENADEDPQAFRAAVPTLVRSGARLIGGCCGTSEAHVAAIRAACYDLGVASRIGHDNGKPSSSR